MKYMYLFIANIAALAFAGHYDMGWLVIAAIVGDFAIWRYWIKHGNK